MISGILMLYAKEVEENACLEIENEELKTGNKLSDEDRDDAYRQKIISKFEKIIDQIIRAGCSEQDVYNVLQIAESNSKLNGWFAGLFFNHDPNDDEKYDYYANHTKRPEEFEKKFKADISRLFQQQYKLATTN